MSIKLTRRAPGWEGNIVAGNTLTLRCPIGLTYHQIFTEFAFLATATPVALEDAVGEIRVMANGRPIWSILASELDKKNQFEGRAAAAGILTIDFDRYNLRSRGAEEYTSVGTGSLDDPTPLTTLNIEMDLKPGSAVTSGTLSSKLKQDESRNLAFFKKLRRFGYSVPGAAVFEVDKLPKGELINMALFFESANDIDNLRLERDNFVMFDRSKELNARIQSDGVRTPIANLYAYDTSEDGNGTEQLVTQGVNDLRFFLDIDGAMDLVVLVEFIGILER